MMRNSFLHFLLGGKTRANKSKSNDSRRKTLVLEALEDRHMLSVSFESPIVNDYIPSATGAVSPNLVEHRLLFAGDFNNDGKSDLLAIENSRAYAYLNSGSKQSAFPNAAVLASSSFYKSMRIGIGNLADGNDHLDLLTASITPTDHVLDFSVYAGMGNGAFYNASTSSSWSGLQALLTSRGVTVPTNGTLITTLGDVFLVPNNKTNGRMDVVCSVSYIVMKADNDLYASGTINLLFINDGKGKFSAAPTATFVIDTDNLKNAKGESIGKAVIMAAGDLTGNSQPDYVTKHTTPAPQSLQDLNKLDIYLNNAAGNSLSKYTTENFSTKFGKPLSIEKVIVQKCQSGNKVIVALKDTAGKNFLCVITVATNGSMTYSELYELNIAPVNIVTGDFDNDGIYDIFVSDGNMYQTLLGQSNGTFKKENAVIANAGFMASYAADFDGDGKIDVLAVGKRFAWLVPGDSTKSPFVVVDFAALNITPKDIAFGDFNGDKKIDFAVLSHLGNEVYVFTNQSTSTTTTFTKTSTLSASFGQSLLVANFDNAFGDDIVIYGVDETGIAKPNLQTYLSNATGGFSAVKTTNLTVAYDILAVGEATNDAFIDIVAVWNGNIGTTTPQNSYYQVLVNSSTNPGSFSNGSKANFGTIHTYPTAVAVGSINGNKNTNGSARNDLVILDADSKSVMILPHSATSGLFNTSTMKSFAVVGTGVTVDYAAFSQLVLADFHAKGVNDVLVGVVTTSGNTQFRVMENDKGTLQTNTNFTTVGNFDGANASGLSFYVGRLDDNGTADVVIVGGNTVKRFINADKSGAEVGTVTLVFRDYSANLITTEIVSLNTLANRLTYIDEWSNFWVEIWANTESSAGISSFVASLNYNADVFEVRTDKDKKDKIEYGNSVTQSANPVKSVGKITLSGTVSGTRGANTNTLLARVSFMPVVTKKSQELMINLNNTGYVQSVANGFSLSSTTIVTSGMSGSPRAAVSNNVPLFPVMFDLNNDGSITLVDFLDFAEAFDKKVSDTGAPKHARLVDYNRDGSVTLVDFLIFAENFDRVSRDKCRETPTLKVSYADNFPTAFLTQSTGSVVMQTSLLIDLAEELATPLAGASAPAMLQQTIFDQSSQNQALLAYIASQETKNDDFDFDNLNPISETERLLAEGKL